jgi:hypothetical protein
MRKQIEIKQSRKEETLLLGTQSRRDDIMIADKKK